MPPVSGSFTGKVKVQTAIALSDQKNHELNLAEIGGTQKTSYEKWNNAAINFQRGSGHLPAVAFSSEDPMSTNSATEEERRYVAFHELGHVAMVYWRRESLHERRIVLHPDRYGGGTVIRVFDQNESDLMVLIGGPMAELLAMGIVPKKAIRNSREYRNHNSDSTRTRNLVRKLCGRDSRKYQIELQERCREIISHSQMWQAITTAAARLFDQGEISGEDCECIFHKFGAPQALF